MFLQLGELAIYDKITDMVLKNNSPKSCTWMNALIIASLLRTKKPKQTVVKIAQPS
jgi:hypothetical protein